MNNIKDEYDKRLNEIELFFDTLQLFDRGQCKITCVDLLGNVTEKEVTSDLSTILKANGFLLLYNLIEATIRKSIDAVLSSIHSSTVTFKNLTDKLRKIWLRQKVKGITLEKYQEKIQDIANIILENEILSFERDCVNISGNIDAKKIREILKQFGGNEISNGRDLQIIKDKRNKLAHGEFSFSEIGKDCSIQELTKYKNETKQYLSQVIDEIKDYIDKQKYLRLDKYTKWQQ